MQLCNPHWCALQDFKGGPHGQTPLMMACSMGWTDGAWELIRNEASLTATDEKGLTARAIAEKCKKKEVVEMIDEYLRPDDEPVQETYAMKQKRDDIEATKARRAEEAKKEEEAGIGAKEHKYRSPARTNPRAPSFHPELLVPVRATDREPAVQVSGEGPSGSGSGRCCVSRQVG